MLPQPAQEDRRRQLTREDVLDVREVAELLRMPRSTIFDYARRGVIPGHKLGRRWVFLHDELEAALRSAPHRASASTVPRPPGLQRPTRAKGRPKRYPEAVPCDASAQQTLALE
jgi:excisionase family DNA binding protein